MVAPIPQLVLDMKQVKVDIAEFDVIEIMQKPVKHWVEDYDVRGRLPSQPKLWSSAAGFAARAVFRAAAAPAALVVDPVARADAGLYRCRVDFRNSPTRNMRLNFTVIKRGGGGGAAPLARANQT
ncbi:hypothetical protein JYU34_019063 [Plutella xylostella]|uniref:Ig-like domain-containing protein n=1 Tax=Plutella xylostella TaxID=51655 RepID=A0ABQ7PZ27_PLUXY|nr:hypothetical protein JYU34_019063 [Plutella xylostella]